MIRIEHLEKRYGDRVVLSADGLVFERGKRYAVIGANGCGKSTLLQLIGGVISPSAGRVVADGDRICYMPQNSIGFSMSVKNNILLAFSGRERRKHRGRAVALARQLGLNALLKKNAAGLSGGETQRVSLARTLAADKDVLLLDEPTASMDVASATAAEEAIEEYAERTGCTLIFATHSFGQAERLADEVIFMHEGVINERGAASELLHSPKSAEAAAFLQFLTSKHQQTDD